MHDEYLQVAVELGIVGAVLLAGLLGALAWQAWNHRTPIMSPTVRAGVLAALASLAVHSGMDFVWHLPRAPADHCRAGRRPPPTANFIPGHGTDPSQQKGGVQMRLHHNTRAWVLTLAAIVIGTVMTVSQASFSFAGDPHTADLLRHRPHARPIAVPTPAIPAAAHLPQLPSQQCAGNHHH